MRIEDTAACPDETAKQQQLQKELYISCTSMQLAVPQAITVCVCGTKTQPARRPPFLPAKSDTTGATTERTSSCTALQAIHKLHDIARHVSQKRHVST